MWRRLMRIAALCICLPGCSALLPSSKEITQDSVHRNRNGSFVADVLGFSRETQITGSLAPVQKLLGF